LCESIVRSVTTFNTYNPAIVTHTPLSKRVYKENICCLYTQSIDKATSKTTKRQMMIQMNDERYATQRGRYLAKITELRKPEAKAIAYTERGYSFGGVAKHMDTSESTIKDYMQRAMALYGLEVTETLLPDEEPPDYDKVKPGYHETLDSQEQEKWVKFITRYQEKLPQEWAYEVIETAKEDGVPVDT